MGELRAIETTYKGHRFRSRLEARWAAMFDLLGWSWEYEPLDLDGYIPDFALVGWKTPLIVEVKPELELDALEVHATKPMNSGWTGEVLLVGAALHDGEFDGVALGLVSQIFDPLEQASFACAELACATDLTACAQRGLIHALGGWACYRCGTYDGNVVSFDRAEARALWGVAGAEVQWHPRRGFASGATSGRRGR